MNISTERLELVLERLKNLAENGPRRKSFGICSNIELWTDEVELLVSDWEHFSGDPEYPVPSMCGRIDGCMYHSCADEETLWDRDTTYGQMRWDLLHHMIKTAESIYEQQRTNPAFSESAA